MNNKRALQTPTIKVSILQLSYENKTHAFREWEITMVFLVKSLGFETWGCRA